MLLNILKSAFLLKLLFILSRGYVADLILTCITKQ